MTFGLGREPLQDLFDLGHLRRVSRADKGPDDDSGQSGLAESVQESDLVIDRDIGGLDLHPLAHRLVAVLDCQAIGSAWDFLLVRYYCLRHSIWECRGW